MKIIFLDIDGVHVTDKGLRSARLAPWAPFDRAAVENLNILIRLTGAGVVISSAWRTDPSLELKWVLKQAGVRCAIIGETPVPNTHERQVLRGEQYLPRKLPVYHRT